MITFSEGEKKIKIIIKVKPQHICWAVAKCSVQDLDGSQGATLFLFLVKSQRIRAGSRKTPMRCVSHVAKDADISSICCANRREVGTAVLEAYLS